MDYTRREFLETMSGATALAGVSCMPAPQTGDDPLGVREDFPVVEQGIYLNSAYITPSPRQAVEAAQSLLRGKSV